MKKDNTLHEIKEAWDSALDAIFLKPQTVEDIVNNLSENTDKYILRKEKLNELNFIAGTFTITALDDKNVLARAELFFQNRSKEWIKDELTKSFTYRFFTKEEFEKLQGQGTMSFKIVHPLK